MSNCKNSKKKKNEITINLSLFLKLYISLVEVTVFTIKSTILWVFFYEVLTISVYCLITYLYKQIQPSPETKIKTKVNRRNKQQQKKPQKTKNNPKKQKTECMSISVHLFVMNYTCYGLDIPFI